MERLVLSLNSDTPGLVRHVRFMYFLSYEPLELGNVIDLKQAPASIYPSIGQEGAPWFRKVMEFTLNVRSGRATQWLSKLALRMLPYKASLILKDGK